MALPSKDPGETVQLEFPYALELNNATIQSVDVENVVQEGTDGAPSSMLTGSATISGSSVLQRYQGGVDGNVYRAKCFATLDDGRILARAISVAVATL